MSLYRVRGHDQDLHTAGIKFVEVDCSIDNRDVEASTLYCMRAGRESSVRPVAAVGDKREVMMVMMGRKCKGDVEG